MKLTFAHGWDRGQQRDINEDSYLVWQIGSSARLNESVFPLPEPPVTPESAQAPSALCLIADGIGGAAAGEVASKLAIETVVQQIAKTLASHKDAAKISPDWGKVIVDAVAQADAAVQSARKKTGNNMGTTLVGALLVNTTAYVVNVGDSRAYHVTSQGIQRITHDHSYVQYLVDSGQLGEQEVRTHPQRNIILRSLGEKNQAPADLFPTTLAPDDFLLLCTDGLWEVVEDKEILSIVRAAPDLPQAAQNLVDAANAGGGADNISVILIHSDDA